MANVLGYLGGAAGFGEITLPRSDDDATRIDISAAFDAPPVLFGQSLAPAAFHVGINGLVSFGTGVTTFPPEGGWGGGVPVIAPFWADVDVRLDGEAPESGAVHVDIDAPGGAVTVTGDAVGRFRRDASAPNTFQLRLLDRGGGDFDAEFRWQEIGWTSGDLSGGAPALVGLGAGPGTLALPGLDAAGLTALPSTPLPGGAGLWRIEVRGGVPLPAPGALMTLAGGSAADALAGGTGNDSLSGGGGNDTLAGGGGADTLVGGAGTDTAVFAFAAAGALFILDGGALVVRDLATGAETVLDGIEFVRMAGQTIAVGDLPLSGTDAAEVLTGGPGPDALSGGGGADTLIGGGGADTLSGGSGTDTAVFAFPLAEAALAWSGGTLTLTGPGTVSVLTSVEWLQFADATIPTTPQTIAGTATAEALQGGAGADAIAGGGGADTLHGGAGNDLLRGEGGDDWLLGGAGNDTLDGGAGSNRLDGGAGLDTAILPFASTEAVLLALPGVPVTVAGPGGTQTLISIETLVFTDTTLSTVAALQAPPGQVLSGGPGPDTLDGGAGNDTLWGAGGADVLDGGGGHDMLNGGDGPDTIVGGTGNDTILAGASTADLRDMVFAGDGDDEVDGGHGNDELRGDAGNDILRGGFGVDSLFGGTGDDSINGGAFSDLVFGGAGDDFLNGGFGFDRLNGGAGADKFFHLGIPDHGTDWVQDFSHAGGDRLMFGQAGATAADFQVNFGVTGAAGAPGVDEAFVIFLPTQQILWALVDGAANAALTLEVAGGASFDLL